MQFNPALVFAVLPCLLYVQTHADDVTPLPRAHAHNDYLHERPLLEALDNGFCSVEADIFLVDGKLLVAHTKHETSTHRTLQKLYLDPLWNHIKQNAGRVHKNGPAFILLIDIKSSGEETWQQLNEVLSGYSDILSRVEDGQFHQGVVTSIVSGDRAFDAIEATSTRYAGIDGRISDIGGGRPSHLMPLISDNWRLYFRWRGKGEFPEKQRNKLHRLVRLAHEDNRRIRFWASPDTPDTWQELNAAAADLINTDDLSGLSEFLREHTE